MYRFFAHIWNVDENFCIAPIKVQLKKNIVQQSKVSGSNVTVRERNLEEVNEWLQESILKGGALKMDQERTRQFEC